MEINPFILALSKTLPESCLQGLVVYLLLQLYFFIDKRSTPLLKFNLFYLANLFLFTGFVYTFFHHYKQIQVTSSNLVLSPNIIKTNYPTSAIEPNLWLKISFWTNHYAYLITGFYLLGLFFCMLKLIIGIINISWFRSNKHLKLNNYLTQISIRLSSNFKLIKTVSVFVSDQIFVPLTLGFVKPIIVFPIALVNQLSAEQTKAILLHELAHIKRNDYLLNLLLCVVQSFLFYNPAIWLMQREINKYREHCCDDLVLDQTQNQLAYAHALLLIEQYRSQSLNLSLASNGKKNTLLNRIKRITNMRAYEPSPQNRFVVLLLAVITIGLSVAWNMPVKRVIKHLADQHFKMIKEVQDTGKVEQYTDVYHKPFISSKKVKVSNKENSIQIFDNINIDTTIKSKNKFKIVLEDSAGNKKEYNSINELPSDARNEFLSIDTGNYASVRKYYNSLEWKMKEDAINKMGRNVDNYYNSPEWKKKEEAINKMGRDVDNYYSSPEWKKKMADIRVKGEKLNKQFNSPEWKKQQEEIREQGEELGKQFNSPEWKAKLEKLSTESKVIGEQARKQFDTPEFKAQIPKLTEESKTISDQTRTQFDMPEFKRQMDNIRLQGEKMRKYYQSPEWKKHQKKIKKEIEKSQKEWKNAQDNYLRPEMPNLPNQ